MTQMIEPTRIRVGDKITLTQRGKGKIYTAEFHHGGQHRHRSLKTKNLKIARQRAMSLEVKLNEGHYATPKKPVNISNAVSSFMESKRVESRAQKTLVKYESQLKGFELFLAGLNIRTLQKLTAEAFDRYRLDQQQGRSVKTVYTGLLIVKTFVKWAVQRELLERNPLTTCKVTEPYVPPKATATLKQVDALLEAATGNRQLQYAILAFTGIRAGELQHLRVQDVDETGKWIHVCASGNWQPKTRRGRKIPIHPRLSEMLKDHAIRSGPYFFCSAPSPKYPNGDHVINVKDLNEAFQALATSLKMPVGRKNDGLVVHSLRHFFETQAVDSGIPQFVIDAWMGHVGHTTTGRTYYGLTDEKSQTYIQQVRF